MWLDVMCRSVWSDASRHDRCGRPRYRDRCCPGVVLGKEFLEAGKKRLLGDTTREATSTEVQDLRRENSQLKLVVAEVVLENRVLKTI